MALVWLVAAIFWARRQRVPVWGWAGAIGVGLTIAAAWWVTYAISKASFDPHPIQALSFTGPSSELLTRVLFVTDKPPTFDLGLVPGVFLGSFIAAALFRELKLEGFEGGASMRRYMLGAAGDGLRRHARRRLRGRRRAVRARPCSRSPPGSRCAPCGPRPR